MPAQKLTIHNFGPISELSIEIKDILIFIGSQASGKSTISKAIFFFKSLRDDLTGYLYQCYSQRQFESSVNSFAKRAKQKFLKIYGPVIQFSGMNLEYQYGNGMSVKICPSSDGKFTDIIFDEMFRNKFRSLIEQARDLYNELQRTTLNFSSSREISAIKAKEATLFELIDTEVNTLFNDERDILFLPAGRSLITILSQQRYNIDMGDESESGLDEESEKLIKLDYLMQNFINRIDNAKQLFSQNIFEQTQNVSPELKPVATIAEKLIKQILKGYYRYENGVERLDFGKGKSTLINFTSSGQQEVVWILLLIVLLIIKKRRVFLVIEEPEAHLFPIAQKQIIDLIALLANQNDNQIILTTHSPYILSSMNNLLYAYQLGKKHSPSVKQIVDSHFWINPYRLEAYMLREGKSYSILDRETELIKSAEIDSASDVIMDTFDRLFELED